MVALLNRLLPSGDARPKPDEISAEERAAAETVTVKYVIDFGDDVSAKTIARMNAAFADEFAAETWVTNRRQS